ncbi:UbiA prenyltransferase family-domain-containing protein [Trametes elegans]|nr:UbiA prenyltransferase family-domain-containing protein [Trametes elegans]
MSSLTFLALPIRTQVNSGLACVGLLASTAITILTLLSVHIYTILLFTISDIKTVLFPVSAFAYATAPSRSVAHLLQSTSWVWVHQLMCNVSNQARSRTEDAANKPWRPLPAGRMSEPQAVRLRWITVIMCLGLSASYGTELVLVTFALVFTTIVYDELGLSGHYLGKSFCNIGGYASLEVGATKIMAGTPHDLDHVSITAVCVSGLLIFTTIQAQDFADVEGDCAFGRVTFPIYAPEMSRLATLVSVTGWSAALCWFWDVGPTCTALFTALGTCVAVRFYCLRLACDDKRTYVLYNIWLAVANIIPMHARRGTFDF